MCPSPFSTRVTPFIYSSSRPRILLFKSNPHLEGVSTVSTVRPVSAICDYHMYIGDVHREYIYYSFDRYQIEDGSLRLLMLFPSLVVLQAYGCQCQSHSHPYSGSAPLFKVDPPLCPLLYPLARCACFCPHSPTALALAEKSCTLKLRIL